MKKLHLFALLLLTLCSLSLTSCKDDEEEVSPNTTLLTTGEWTGEGIYVGSLPLSFLLAQLGEKELAEEADITDWILDFEKNGTFSLTTDGVTENGTWKFADNEKRVIIIGNDKKETNFTVKKLTEKNLNLEINVEDMGYDPADLQGVSKFELRFVR